MARPPKRPPLRVYLNNLLVGRLLKEPSGAIEFEYDPSWLEREIALPISLSLQLREDAYRGEAVSAVFENLLPDSDALRRKVAEKVGAAGIDAYSMLARIGRDCVGALQFIAGDDELSAGNGIEAEPVDEEHIEKLLKNLAQAPLGLNLDDDFRISIAGAQEKTALLFNERRWCKPHGTTPTTHILKTPMGALSNGIDLSNSVENEYYCLKILEAAGLNVNTAKIERFGDVSALVVERFDRRWTNDGRLIRLPQEDCCQALSVPPSLKYQSEGGPGIGAILNLLKGSDRPAEDQKNFLIAQILFWVLGATDGHAKNFSIFLGARGGYRMTPIYDVLTSQPSLDKRQIERRQMKLAMSVGESRHYRIDQILPRHFMQTAKKAGVPEITIKDAMRHVAERGWLAFDAVERELPANFPSQIHESVRAAAKSRIESLKAFDEYR